MEKIRRFKTPDPLTIRYRPTTSNSNRSGATSSFNKRTKSPYLNRSQKSARIDHTINVLPVKNRLLSKLTNRKLTKPLKISPNLAQAVIKLYFLPYFEEKTKIENEKDRFFCYGHKSKSPLRKHYTRLSELLSESLKKSKLELTGLQVKLSKVTKEKESKVLEVREVKENIERMSLNLGVQDFQKRVYKDSVVKQGLLLSFTSQEAIELKGAALEGVNRYLALNKSVNAERSFNEHLKNSSKQAKFWHDLYQMFSQLSGEALKGTYFSILNLLHKDCLEVPLTQSLETLNSNTKSLESSQNAQILYITASTLQKSLYINKAHKQINQRLSTFKDAKNLKQAAVDHLTRLDLNLRSTYRECENLSTDLQGREKEIMDFSVEYESITLKLREAQASKRLQNPELLCKNCNKNYFEANNFNWTCCTHQSEWSGTMYWCCGSINKESIGCNKSKHKARDEETEEEEKEQAKIEEIIRGKEKNEFCSSCKKQGHSAHDCKSDPNAITDKLIVKKAKIKLRDQKKIAHKHFGSRTPSTKMPKTVFGDITKIRETASQNPSPILTRQSSFSSEQTFHKLIPRSETFTNK